MHQSEKYRDFKRDFPKTVGPKKFYLVFGFGIFWGSKTVRKGGPENFYLVLVSANVWAFENKCQYFFPGSEGSQNGPKKGLPNQTKLFSVLITTNVRYYEKSVQ